MKIPTKTFIYKTDVNQIVIIDISQMIRLEYPDPSILYLTII